MSAWGAAPLPEHPYRARLTLHATGAGWGEREDRVRGVVERVNDALGGGELRRSGGSVGCLPGDGFTWYYDAVGEDWVFWSYYGTDYGHPFEAELQAASPERLLELLERVRASLDEAGVSSEVGEPPMPTRADA